MIEVKTGVLESGLRRGTRSARRAHVYQRRRGFEFSFRRERMQGSKIKQKTAEKRSTGISSGLDLVLG
jgi:hypothetical protein